MKWEQLSHDLMAWGEFPLDILGFLNAFSISITA
jgi:hypothetical protein